MPRYGSARGKWHRQKKPRYEEDKDETQGNSAIYCRDCRRITLRVHDCDPICQMCGKHFSPGDGCPDLCDTVCCCGCCGCCGQSETSVFDKTESVLTSLATELSYNDPLQPPKLQITFLLKPAMNTLVDFLLSDRKLDIEFSRAPYRAVIRTVGGKDCFVNMAYETIDPMIRALEGKVVTADMLHEIRTKQVLTPSIWQDPNGGYLDFVTHIQNPDYWRPYVGQSNGPKERIPQHTRAIRNGSEDSLHYYIIKQGKGLRVANFIRLWTIPCPGKTDDTVIFVFSNFLEKAMCRAFQSLPAQTLELFFGPCPQGQYSGMGLNIMSPLLQGKELGPTIRHDTVNLLEESPDPEIRNWPSIRKSSYDTAARHREAIQSLSRVYMTENDYYAALGQAFATNPSLREALPMQIDSNIWGSLDEELVDVDTWFKAVLAQLHQQNPASETKFANPVGTSQASVGIILDLTPLHEYEVGDRAVNLPWGLRESGFEESNSLIWVYNLQQYLHIPGSFQVAPEYCMNMKVIRAATRRLIVGSRLRIIILCSDNAEEVALPDDASSRKVTLVLNGTTYNAWIETDQRSITRMFIRAPAPLSELWATHGRQAFQLTNIFRFVSTVTGLNIFSILL